MPKASEEGLQKHTLNLFEGDYAKIMAMFPDVGAGLIVRKIVRKFIEQVEAGSGDASVNLEINI